MELSFEQIRHYWEHRHPGQRIPAREKISVCCVLHGENNPSCTLYLDGNGGFNCHACGAKGNLFQFEAQFSGCDLRQAEINVAEITGAKASAPYANLGPPVAFYDYRDENGKVLYQKRRYEPEGEDKTFRVYLWTDKGFVLSCDKDPSARRVLYNLPDVVKGNVVFLCEGEKDADNLLAANLFRNAGFLIATTSNHAGADEWRESYNPYFTGKMVFIFADNDKKGRLHAETIAAAIHKYAYRVRIVYFDELPEKGDVSDYLELYGAEKLEEKMKTIAPWTPPESGRENWLVNAVEWAATANAEVDWLVDGVIQADANGMIAGEPKTCKSLTVLFLLLSMACGRRWLGRAVKRRVRTAYISREDSPLLTKVRFQGFLRGMGLDTDPSGWLWCNTREQLGDFSVDNDEHLRGMAHDLKERGVEFAVLDVFNRLHARSENDNTEMAQVVERINQLGREAGCSIGLVHHVSKENGSRGRFFTRIRGASSIHGWTEWSIGLSLENPGAASEGKKLIRRAEFESKAGESAPLLFTVEFGNGNLRLELNDPLAYGTAAQDWHSRYQ